jgi:hypothetical protein
LVEGCQPMRQIQLSAGQFLKEICAEFSLNLKILITHIHGQVQWRLLLTRYPILDVTMAFIMRWDIADLASDYPATLVPGLANSLLEIQKGQLHSTVCASQPARYIMASRGFFLQLFDGIVGVTKRKLKTLLHEQRVGQTDRATKKFPLPKFFVGIYLSVSFDTLNNHIEPLLFKIKR